LVVSAQLSGSCRFFERVSFLPSVVSSIGNGPDASTAIDVQRLQKNGHSRDLPVIEQPIGEANPAGVAQLPAFVDARIEARRQLSNRRCESAIAMKGQQ
jgi:hypothetical protein